MGKRTTELLEIQLMLRTNKRRFYPDRRAPFVARFLRRKLGIEQLCDECSKPYLAKPAAKPIKDFVIGSAVALIFVEHRFGKAHFYVQFGRCATDGRNMIVSQLLSQEHLEDLAEVALMARSFIREQKPLRLVSRA